MGLGLPLDITCGLGTIQIIGKGMLETSLTNKSGWGSFPPTPCPQRALGMDMGPSFFTTKMWDTGTRWRLGPETVQG